MAAVEHHQKEFLEKAADYFTAFVVGYLVWTIGFQLPKIPVVHEFVGIIASVALAYWALKSLRKSKMVE